MSESNRPSPFLRTTQIPWKYDEKDGSIYHDDSDVCPLVATVNFGNADKTTADADGRLIVCAVNCHAELLSFARQLEKIAEYQILKRQKRGADREEIAGVMLTLNMVRAAIRKAESMS